MAEVWHRKFADKFSKFGHQWELISVPPENEDRADGIFEDTAKIRFVCNVSFDSCLLFMFYDTVLLPTSVHLVSLSHQISHAFQVFFR